MKSSMFLFFVISQVLALNAYGREIPGREEDESSSSWGAGFSSSEETGEKGFVEKDKVSVESSSSKEARTCLWFLLKKP